MSWPPPDPPAPWYEKAFKIQLLVLLTAAAIAGPVFAFMQIPQPGNLPPWFWPAAKVFMGIAGPIVAGGLAIQMVRHLLWLFGRGPCVETWIGPPPRVNCVIMGLASPVLAGVAFEGRQVFGIIGILAALLLCSLMFLLSLTGFLWAHAEARKPCQKT